MLKVWWVNESYLALKKINLNVPFKNEEKVSDRAY